MAGPITWHALMGQSLADASRPMALAGATFDNAFNVFNKALEQQQQANTTAYTRQRDSNTQNFLDTLQQYRTPEELAAAQAQLDQQRTGYGDMIDRAAVRGAQEARMGTLRDQTQKEWAFNDAALTRDQRGLRDEISSLVYQDPNKAAELLTQHPELMNQAEIQRAITDRRRTLVTQDQQDKQFKWSEEKNRFEVDQARPLELQAKRASIAASQASAEASHESVLNSQFNRKQAEAVAQQKQRDTYYSNVLKGTPFEQGTLDTAEGMQAFTDWVTKNIPGKAQREDILYNIGQLSSQTPEIGKDAQGNSIRVGIPVAEAIRQVMGSSENNPVSPLIPGWSRRGDVARNNLESLYKDPAFVNMALAYAQVQANRALPPATLKLPGASSATPGESEGPIDPGSAAAAESIRRNWDAIVKASIEKKAQDDSAKHKPVRPLQLNYGDLRGNR